MPNFSIIVAIANNNAIGQNGGLLVHLPKDMKWFKENTLHKTVIMGRKTFETLPNGALKERRNIVVTKNNAFRAENCEIVHSIEELMTIVHPTEDCFIIGGGEIYKMLMPYATHMYITRIHADFADADTFFPEIDKSWQLVNKVENKADEKHSVDFDFLIYTKNNLK